MLEVTLKSVERKLPEVFEKKGIPLVEIDGKKYYLVKDKKIPAEFGWYLFFNILVKMGFELKLYYNDGTVREKPDYFEYDPEYKGIAPVRPWKVEIFKTEAYVAEVKDEFKNLFGNVTVKKETKKIAEIIDRIGLDPTVDESVDLFSLLF